MKKNVILIIVNLVLINSCIARDYDLIQLNNLMCIRQKKDNKLPYSCSDQKISNCNKKELDKLSYKELIILKDTDKLTGSCKILFKNALHRKLYIINGVPLQKL